MVEFDPIKTDVAAADFAGAREVSAPARWLSDYPSEPAKGVPGRQRYSPGMWRPVSPH